jgi:hypothetical protein
MALDLIYTRKETAEALDFATIIDNCPAVLTETASPETSGKYGFVNTMQAMQILGDFGYKPTQAVQRPSRKQSHKPFAMHMISFAHDDDLNNPYNETRPEVLLYNSHDGKSALKLYAGAFRFVCSNGIVAGDGFQSKLRHSSKTAGGFESLLRDTVTSLPLMMQRICKLQETELTDDRGALEFAYDAANLRWQMAPQDIGPETKQGAYFTTDTIKGLFRSNRPADNGTSAWQIFNRIQENILRGGPDILSITKAQKETGQYWGKQRKAKAVSSLPETVRINRNLWDMADALA